MKRNDQRDMNSVWTEKILFHPRSIVSRPLPDINNSTLSQQRRQKKSVTQFKWIKIHLNAWMMYNSVQYENEANLPSKAFLCFPRWHFKHEIAMTRFKQDWVSALSLAFLPSSSFLLTRKTQCGFISCNLFALGIKRGKMEIFTATQFG